MMKCSANNSLTCDIENDHDVSKIEGVPTMWNLKIRSNVFRRIFDFAIGLDTAYSMSDLELRMAAEVTNEIQQV